MFKFLVFLLSFSIFSAELKVITFNAGLLKRYSLNFVPCVNARLSVLEDELIRYWDEGENIVYAFQEVWTRDSFEQLNEFADHYGLAFFPETYEDLQRNGLVILTNTFVTDHYYEAFEYDHTSRGTNRGIRAIEIVIEDETILLANTHTAYSGSTDINSVQRMQFDQIHDFLEFQTAHYDNLVIAGDFNSGPALRYDGPGWIEIKELWEDLLVAPMAMNGMEVKTQVINPTWDYDNNLMVSNPTFAIKLYSWFTSGHWGADSFHDVLDHVFASISLNVVHRQRVLDEEVQIPSSCIGRTDEEGYGHLSDHYGNMVILEI